MSQKLTNQFCKRMIILTCILLSANFLNSQTVIVPAVNTNTGSVNDPLGTYFGFERSAMIYTSAQIGATTGNISSIGFYLNSSSTPGASTDVRIYMKMRTTLFTAVSNYTTETTGATLVYGPTTMPSSAFSAAGWITIPLTTSFNYTGGTNHLEIIIETNTTGGGNEGTIGKQFRYSSPGNNQHYQSWNADNSPPTGNGTRSASRPNVQLTFTSVVPCSGTPTAGTTVLAPNNGAISSSVNGTVTGSTTGTGLSYQWQYSDDGSTWVNISGQTGATLTTTAISTIGTRQYRRSITCSGTTSHSTPATYTTLLVYCTTVSTLGDNISGFSTTGGITNISNLANGGNSGGYTDFYSSNSVSQYDGFNINFTETYNGGSHGFSIWIDFNINGTFEAGERVFNAPSTANGHTGSFTIPAGTAAGDYRMRIRGWWGNLNPDPCTSISYGEAEDYKLTVVQSCAAVINSVTSTTICGSGTSAVSVTGNVSTTNINLYSNATGGTALSSITGEAGTLTSPSISSNTTYYVEASNGTCQSIRTPINIVVNPIPTAVTASTSIASICVGGSVDLTSSAVSNSDVNLNYTESFETGLPAGWLISNAGSGNNWSVTTSPTASPPTGSGALEYSYSFFDAANTWAFTQPFNLVAGVTYTISSKYASSSIYSEAFKVTVGTSQTVAGQTTVLDNYVSVSTGSIYLTQSTTYTPSTSGVYYFAWNCYSSAFEDYLNIDDISITGSVPQPATFAWTSSPAGFTSSTQNPTGATPTVTTTYTVEATNGYGCKATNSVDVTVINPTATITSTSSTICHGNTVALTGTVTVPNSVVNIDNGVGAVTAVGTTWSVNVSPIVSTTYSITSVTSGGCTGSGTGSTTFTLPTLGTDISANGTKTCAVTENNWVQFYDASGLLIGAINSGGLNLGNVSIEVASSTAGYMNDCVASTNPLYSTAYMGKSWIVKSSLYNGTDFPALSNVLVRLPYSSSNLSAMNTVASTQTTGNPNDDGATASTLMLTKHTATTENHNPLDNCLSGTTRGIAQSGNGVITTTYPGLTAATGSDYVEFKVAQFSEMFLNKNFNTSPLPVKLTNFSATCGKGVILNWTTASEQNSDRFIVEKSRDGQTWSLVATQTAAGTSNTIINYTQTDENSWNGVTYYRLRQIDFNGAEEVYGPISVSCEGNESSMTVYPNPNSGSFTIEISSTEMYSNAQLFLTDLTGKVISSQNVNVANGTTQILINDLNLKMGTYLVTLRGADQQLKPVKVVVTK